MKNLLFLIFLIASINLYSQRVHFKVNSGEGTLNLKPGQSLLVDVDRSSTYYNHGKISILNDTVLDSKLDFFYRKTDKIGSELFFFIGEKNPNLFKISYEMKSGKWILTDSLSKWELSLVVDNSHTLYLESQNAVQVLSQMFALSSDSYILQMENLTSSSIQKSIFDELEIGSKAFLFINPQNNKLDIYTDVSKLKKSPKVNAISVEGSFELGNLTIIADCTFKNIREKWVIGLRTFEGRIIGEIETSSDLKNNLVSLNDHNKNLTNSKFLKLSEDTLSPLVKVFRPRVDRDLVMKSSSRKVIVEGSISDDSQIKFFSINGVETPVVKSKFLAPSMIYNNKIEISAVDIWGNTFYQEYEVLVEENLDNNETITLDNIGNYFALIIGVNKYQDKRIPQLDNPIQDGKQLKNTLVANYTFENNNITVLENPDRKSIFKALQDMKSLIGKNDNFLLFYAGHGFFDKEMDSGYWLPTDSEKDNKAEWISFDDVLNHIRAIGSKHTLVISDACFSGGFLKERNVTLSDKAMQDLYQVTSRKVITSGNLTTVPDESVFMKYLLKSLSENQDKYFTEENLFDKIKIPVLNNSETTPLIGVLSKTGDEGGNFIFIKR